MMRTMCKSKIHGATVTEANLHYMGSLTVDRDLMEAADIAPYEWLYVVNISTGARFETYAIEGEAGSGIIGLNGAAARLGQPGDRLIIMCPALVAESEVPGFRPRLVFVDEHNRMIQPAFGDRTWNLENAGPNVESQMNEAMRNA
jgi:aspartate 1-decarboxylase